jgi:hypothetical protein
LKYDFDAKGEDAWIEEIVSKIENGLLWAPKKLQFKEFV